MRRPYHEVIQDHAGAEDVPIQGEQVRLQRVDQEAGSAPVDVHAVLLQQLPLVPPTFRPVLGQLLHLRDTEDNGLNLRVPRR